jgi:hypothetical protein
MHSVGQGHAADPSDHGSVRSHLGSEWRDGEPWDGADLVIRALQAPEVAVPGRSAEDFSQADGGQNALNVPAFDGGNQFGNPVGPGLDVVGEVDEEVAVQPDPPMPADELAGCQSSHSSRSARTKATGSP